MQRTLVLLKPDAVQRGLVGPILARFEAKGLKIVGLKLRQFPKALIQKHYEAHKARPFYGDLVRKAPDPVIPHPRLHERRFVLVPLAEIAPGLVHPVLGQTVAELVARCPDPSAVRPYPSAGAGAR